MSQGHKSLLPPGPALAQLPVSTAFNPQGGHPGNVVTAVRCVGKPWERGRQACLGFALQGTGGGQAVPHGTRSGWGAARLEPGGRACSGRHGPCRGEQRGAREKMPQAAQHPRSGATARGQQKGEDRPWSLRFPLTLCFMGTVHMPHPPPEYMPQRCQHIHSSPTFRHPKGSSVPLSAHPSPPAPDNHSAISCL